MSGSLHVSFTKPANLNVLITSNASPSLYSQRIEHIFHMGLFEPHTPQVQSSQQLTNLVSVYQCGIILSLSFSSPKQFFPNEYIYVI